MGKDENYVRVCACVHMAVYYALGAVLLPWQEMTPFSRAKNDT